MTHSSVYPTTGNTSVWRCATIWLNATDDESGSKSTSDEEQASISRSFDDQGLTDTHQFLVWIVEDNPPDVLLVREAIRAENLPVTVHVLADGQDAIDHITATENDVDTDAPDCLIVDINLPKRDGFEVLHTLRAGNKLRDVPAIVVTSSDKLADRARATQLDAQYFKKPTSYRDFLKLGTILSRILINNS